MFKAVCKQLVHLKMSQKLTALPKSSAGQKRKHEEVETAVELDENCIIRAQISNLARKNAALSPNIGLTWFQALSEEFSKEYFKELGEFLRNERTKYTVYPPEQDVYYWTNTVKIQDVKVVILGQDPYHGANQAHGLAFSVRKGMKCPPSLMNVFRELFSDMRQSSGFDFPPHGFLYGWASQGVLLLNVTLTVRAGQPDSHAGKWSPLTDAVIKWINTNLPNTVFMLWGKKAQEKISLITEKKHLILTAAHPSPFSAMKGFYGCCHFSKANDYLKNCGKNPINWNYLP